MRRNSLAGHTRPGCEAIHYALYKAYFVDRKNLAELDVLVDIAEQVGMDGVRAREVLETREFSAAIDEHWTHSRQIGVTGVPTFVAGGYGVVGAQRYESIEALLQQASAQPRAN